MNLYWGWRFEGEIMIFNVYTITTVEMLQLKVVPYIQALYSIAQYAESWYEIKVENTANAF